MKKQILILFTLICFNINCQESSTSDQVLNQDANSSLYQYFSEKIPSELLEIVTYPARDSNIRISFFVNNEKNAFNIATNTRRNNALNKKLINAFEEYPLKNLSIDFDTSKKYEFAVITRKYGKNLIASTFEIFEETAPNCTSCNDLNFYTDIKKCITDKIRFYFYDKINFSLATNLSNKDEDITLKIKVQIDTLGILRVQNIDAPEIFKQNITKIVSDFPHQFTPYKKGDKSIPYFYNFNLQFKKGDAPKAKEPEIYFDSIFKPTTDNKFATYLKNNLSVEDIKKANLNRINDRLVLYFELQKDGTPFEISTNLRSKSLENKIIELFKNYNISNLNIVDKQQFNKYFTSLIVFENGEYIVKTNSIIGYSRGAVFNGCESTKTVQEMRNCFSREIQLLFSSKFNSKLPNKLRLDPGILRINIVFKVSKEGEIVDITSNAPHEKLKEEILRVMEKLPKLEPAVFGREKVKARYSIPFTLRIE